MYSLKLNNNNKINMIQKELKNIEIFCLTEIEAIICCNIAHYLGWKKEDGSSYLYKTEWDKNEEHTSYDFYQGKIFHFHKMEYTQKSADWFINKFLKDTKNIPINSYGKTIKIDFSDIKNLIPTNELERTAKMFVISTIGYDDDLNKTFFLKGAEYAINMIDFLITLRDKI